MDDLNEFIGLMALTTPPLDEALAAISAYGRPEADRSDILDLLDELAVTTSGDDATAVCAALFGTGGFVGDTATYYDPANSLLDRVLERRVGIPITLSVLAIEVGRRRGIDMVGVGVPGHFLVRARNDERSFFDAFDGGRALDPHGVEALFHRLHGNSQAFRGEFLTPTPTVAIVARVLNNLRGAYARLNDREGLLRSLALQSALPGAGLETHRQMAQVMAADGRFLDAAVEHDLLVELDPQHASHHSRAAIRLRAQLN